jgi:hypothetical protein
MDTKRMQQLANLIKEIEDESSIQTATELRKILHEEVDGMVDELIHQYGADAFRYVLLREVSFGQDGDVAISAMRSRINSDLANAYVQALSHLIGELALKEAKVKRELLEKQITEAMQKSYQSPMVREAVIQSLIREYETARLDERKDNPFLAQVDMAEVPELKAKPKKALIAVITTLVTGFLLLLFVFIRNALRNAEQDPESKEKLSGLKKLFKKQMSFRS